MIFLVHVEGVEKEGDGTEQKQKQKGQTAWVKDRRTTKRVTLCKGHRSRQHGELK